MQMTNINGLLEFDHLGLPREPRDLPAHYDRKTDKVAEPRHEQEQPEPAPRGDWQL